MDWSGLHTFILIGCLKLIEAEWRIYASIGSDNGILLVGPLGTNFSELLIEIHTFSFTKCIWKCRLRNSDHFVSASILLWILLHGSKRSISTKAPFLNFSVTGNCDMAKYKLDTLNHVHICQVSLQLSCVDTCQIWMWYDTGNEYFDPSENCENNGTQNIGLVTRPWAPFY